MNAICVEHWLGGSEDPPYAGCLTIKYCRLDEPTPEGRFLTHIVRSSDDQVLRAAYSWSVAGAVSWAVGVILSKKTDPTTGGFCWTSPRYTGFKIPVGVTSGPAKRN